MKIRRDGPGCPAVQDVPGWSRMWCPCPGPGCAGMDGHRTGSVVQDPPQRRTLSRMGRSATGMDGPYLVWLHSAGPGTGKIWPPDQWSRISGPGSAAGPGTGSVVQDVPPCVVSRCPGMLCGFHICAVAAYRVAGGWWCWVLIDKHKKRPVFYAGLVCVLWFLLDSEYTADNCNGVQDPALQGLNAAFLLRLFIMHNCSALQP